MTGHVRTIYSDCSWERILNSNDDKALWKSINWKGEVHTQPTDRPGDSEFQAHLENVLNPPDILLLELDNSDYLPYIPILDDPIDINEVQRVIDKQLNTNKDCDTYSFV